MKFLFPLIAFTLTLISCDSLPPHFFNETRYVLWTTEDQENGGLPWIRAQLDAFTAAYQETTGHKVEVIIDFYRDEGLPFLLYGLHPSLTPDLVLTRREVIYQFWQMDALQPASVLPGWDPGIYLPQTIEGVKFHGSPEIWGVPFSYGNQLLLYFNKELVLAPPQTAEELAQVAADLNGDNLQGLVFLDAEPFWLTPWLHGFKGRIFAEDGATPTLNTPAMIEALRLIRELKPDSEPQFYPLMDNLFRDRKAAMIINGDWSFDDYYATYGSALGVTPLPIVNATGLAPIPFGSTTAFVITQKNNRQPSRLGFLSELLQYFAKTPVQLDRLRNLGNVLPVTRDAAQEDFLPENPEKNALLKTLLETQINTLPLPVHEPMRYNWDAMRQGLVTFFLNKDTPEQTALRMQETVESLRNPQKPD